MSVFGDEIIYSGSTERRRVNEITWEINNTCVAYLRCKMETATTHTWTVGTVREKHSKRFLRLSNRRTLFWFEVEPFLGPCRTLCVKEPSVTWQQKGFFKGFSLRGQQKNS